MFLQVVVVCHAFASVRTFANVVGAVRGSRFDKLARLGERNQREVFFFWFQTGQAFTPEISGVDPKPACFPNFKKCGKSSTKKIPEKFSP